jgi:hypothetical protein
VTELQPAPEAYQDKYAVRTLAELKSLLTLTITKLAWTVFLKSPNLCEVLTNTEGGWLSEKVMDEHLLQYDGKNFESVFINNSSVPYYEYSSYDNFFAHCLSTRGQARGITYHWHNDKDDLRIIGAPCESSLSSVRTGIKLTD